MTVKDFELFRCPWMLMVNGSRFLLLCVPRTLTDVNQCLIKKREMDYERYKQLQAYHVFHHPTGVYIVLLGK